MTRPRPWVVTSATRPARKTGTISVAGKPTISITMMDIEKVTGNPALTTAAMTAPTAKAGGIAGKIRLTADPTAPPTKNKGKIGPPIKPVFKAPARATILARARTINKAAPRTLILS